MKWYTYLICSILIVLGIIFGVNFVKDVTSSSWVAGESIAGLNKTYTDSFSWSRNGVTFALAEDGTTWEFDANLPVSQGFDGEVNVYEVKVNNEPLITAQVIGGAISDKVYMSFYDIEGTLVCEGSMDILIRFYPDHTALKLSCNDEQSKNYFEQNFKYNGFKISVQKITEE